MPSRHPLVARTIAVFPRVRRCKPHLTPRAFALEISGIGDVASCRADGLEGTSDETGQIRRRDNGIDRDDGAPGYRGFRGAVLPHSKGPGNSVILKRILERGAISIGHREASVPFSYISDEQKVEGYSVDLCMKVVDAVRQRLSKADLKVTFTPYQRDQPDPAGGQRERSISNVALPRIS